MLDAEALLFIDDYQAEVLELHVGRDQPVRADDDVDTALGQSFQDAPLLGGSAEAADALDHERVLRQALAECAKMLLGEHGGRHQHRHLLAVVDGLEGGADGQLGFAVAHVAADEAVHWPGALHVALDLGHRRELVRRFLVCKGGVELGLPFAVRGIGDAGLGFAQGLEVDHVAGEVDDGRLDPVFAPLPAGAAEL